MHVVSSAATIAIVIILLCRRAIIIILLFLRDWRATLIAEKADDGYHFDIHLQGDRETVFLDV